MGQTYCYLVKSSCPFDVFCFELDQSWLVSDSCSFKITIILRPWPAILSLFPQLSLCNLDQVFCVIAHV